MTQWYNVSVLLGLAQKSFYILLQKQKSYFGDFHVSEYVQDSNDHNNIRTSDYTF